MGALLGTTAPVIAAVAALFLASQSRKRIAISGGSLTGDGLNRAAIVVAWVNIALSILGLLGFIFIWSSWMNDANDTFAVLLLRLG